MGELGGGSKSTIYTVKISQIGEVTDGVVKELRSMLKVWKACLLGVEYRADQNVSRKMVFSSLWQNV